MGNSGSLAAKRGIVNLVKEDAEKGSGLFVRVRLELGLDLEDECGSHG